MRVYEVSVFTAATGRISFLFTRFPTRQNIEDVFDKLMRSERTMQHFDEVKRKLMAAQVQPIEVIEN